MDFNLAAPRDVGNLEALVLAAHISPNAIGALRDAAFAYLIV
jgi:hypothetical protein